MNDLEKRLLDGFQRDFPLTSRPFAVLADELGVSENQVIETLKNLKERGAVSRLGAVFRPGAVGASTLAAMEVPEERLEEIADLVSGFEAVNHNYEREHRLNLWFVVTAPNRGAIQSVLAEIQRRSGLKVLDLPMMEGYHLDLGFDLKWS